MVLSVPALAVLALPVPALPVPIITFIRTTASK